MKRMLLLAAGAIGAAGFITWLHLRRQTAITARRSRASSNRPAQSKIFTDSIDPARPSMSS